VGDLGGGVKRRAAAMLAWPAKGKLVKLAKACFPGREPNSRSGAVTTVALAIQVAAQIGGAVRPSAGKP
jgi:hypothetical protein